MFLYCIATDQGSCKFGFSREPQRRLRALQTGSADPLFLIDTVRVVEGSERQMECLLHSEIGNHRRIHGEWYSLSAEEGATVLAWFRIHYAEVLAQ